MELLNPEADWQVRCRVPCQTCHAKGTVPSGERGFWTCLECGGGGYHERWLRLTDFLDVAEWKKRRLGETGGA